MMFKSALLQELKDRGYLDWSYVPCTEISPMTILEFTLFVRAFGSKREARPRLSAGACRISGDPCYDPSQKLEAGGEYCIQIGRTSKYKVKVKD